MAQVTTLLTRAAYRSSSQYPPSSISSVLYIEMDSTGAWKSKLAQEFVQSKLPINLKALLGG